MKWIVMVALCVLTAAVYTRAAFCPFNILDDYDYVLQNTHVLSGLSFESIQWAFTSFAASNWHPVTWLSLLLDSQFFGSNPMGYHIVNIALHVANSALLFCLFNYMTGALWRSAFLAALFALHPMHVESVAWIAERKDVLSTLFWLLTLFCYAAYVKNSRRGMYLLSLCAFALGLMAKPMLVTIPVALLLLDFWPLQRLTSSSFRTSIERRRVTALLLEKVPFLLLSAVSCVLTLTAQKTAMIVLAQLPVVMRISNALWSLCLYVKMMCFPVDLAIFYPIAPVALWKGGVGALLLLVALFVVARNAKTRPYLAVGFFWYLVTLVPVIGLIQVGAQAMADRYSYVPFIGLFVMASWGCGDLANTYPHLRKLLAGAAMLLVVLCAAGTFHQLGYWQDNVTLFTRTIEITEDNWMAHTSLGSAYAKKRMFDMAVREFNQALEINPVNAATHYNLATLLSQKMGRYEESLRHYELAITVNPRMESAHYNLAGTLVNMGRLNEAVTEYFKALEIEPNEPDFHNDLGMALLQLGRYDESIRQISEALRLKPTFEQAVTNLQFARQQKAQHVR
jgi:protein O-mannosyl-transferase